MTTEQVSRCTAPSAQTEGDSDGRLAAWEPDDDVLESGFRGTPTTEVSA